MPTGSPHGRDIRGVLPYRPMFGKILLTAAVILGAYLVIRARMQRGSELVVAPAPCREPLVPAGAMRTIAYSLVALMLGGSLFWLYLDWEESREVVTVQVINANTGDISTYQARRGEVKGRRFTTLDGRPIYLSDVDRMMLQAQPPTNMQRR